MVLGHVAQGDGADLPPGQGLVEAAGATPIPGAGGFAGPMTRRERTGPRRSA
jgi:hypothetical protein